MGHACNPGAPYSFACFIPPTQIYNRCCGGSQFGLDIRNCNIYNYSYNYSIYIFHFNRIAVGFQPLSMVRRIHMIEEGTVVYYLDEDAVHSGRVIDVTPENGGFTFSIDSYGACEGPYVIASGQIGKTVFFSEKEAEDRLGI